MDILAAKIAEWTETVEDAPRELDAALLHARANDQLVVAEEETGLELDPARGELAAMGEAQRLLERVGVQLDLNSREEFARAVELLCSVDWPARIDSLAGEAQRLRELLDRT